MAHDFRGSTTVERLARGGSRGSVRLPATEALAAGAHALDCDAHRGAVPLNPAAAAQRVIESGIFEQIAADMIRVDREIVANAKPRPDFWETFAAYAAKTNMPIVAMRGWGQ